MFLIDSHCHLDQLNYNSLHYDVADVIKKANKRDVRLILAVCSILSNFDQMKALIGSRNDVLFACGIHPLNIDKNYDALEELRRIATRKEIVALGETGLDYSNIQPSQKKQQQEVFLEHMRISNDQHKPIIVHTRNAINDTIALLQEGKAYRCGGILHCFTADRHIAKNILDIGFYISFSGIVTFRNADILRDTVKFVPLNSLLIETDSPYLTPVPYRSKENQPAYVRDIAEYIAMLKNVTLEQFAAVTTANFCRLFNLQLKNLII